MPELRSIAQPGPSKFDYLLRVVAGVYYAYEGVTGQLVYGGPNNTGGVDGTKADAVIQAVVNALANGGSIYLKAGIYNLTTVPITLPYGPSFYFYGDGVPDWLYPVFQKIPCATPTTGTQIRGPTSMLSAGTTVTMFSRGYLSANNQQGTLAFFDLQISPPWGTTTSGTIVYGIYDQGSAVVEFDNVIFAPWGWSETGVQPLYATDGTGNAILASYYAPVGNSGGTELRIGKIILLGLGVAATWTNIDNIGADRITLGNVYQGPQINCIFALEIGQLICYVCGKSTGALTYRLYITGSTLRGQHIGHIADEAGANPAASNYFIYLQGTSQIRVDYVYNYSTPKVTKITNVTNDAQLEGLCQAWNMAGTRLWQQFPISKAITNPFGDTIATPFKDTSPFAVGSGGANANPTTGRTYTVNEPIDVTIAGGVGVSITTKDSNGTTIDNAVATLTNRTLLNAYTLAVTYTGVPTTTIVQATIGAGGTTATPLANVNYVANQYDLLITSSGGVAVSISTKDGSSTTGGNTMDTALVALTRYLLRAGQSINLGGFGVAPTLVIVRS